MSKQVLSLSEKLEKLEKQKHELLNQRRKEILKIIEASGALDLDDRILAGALLFLKDGKNKDHSIIQEFKSYIEANRGSRTRSKTKDKKPDK